MKTAAKSAAPRVAAAKASTHQGSTAQPSTRVAKGGKGGYAIQLGAFRTQAKALASWQVVAKKFPKELASRKPRTASAGTATAPLYRLQAAVSGEAEAKSLCVVLKAHQQVCIVVKI